MKLARLSEKVLAALREGQIKMEMAEAMTVSGDHERQDNMLAALLSAPYSFNARSIRHHLMSEKIRASSSLGTFVLEWYRAEGLAETADLFGEEVWLDDAAAVERIGLTLLEEKVEALKADGWKWVRTALEYSCELFEGVEFSDPDIEAIDEDGKDDFSPGRRAECGCIVYLHHGTLFIEEGAVLNDVIEADQPVTEDGSGTMPANENVSNEGASAEAAPCYSRALVDTLSVHRTRALQLAISKDKSTALSLLLFNLHLGISGRSGIYHSPSNLRAAASHQFAPKAEEDCVNRAEDALKQAVGEVNIVDDGYLSSEQAIALFDSIHAMSDDEKLNAIILHTALSVDAPMAGGCLPRNGMAEHIGVLLGVDVTTAWRPDPDFLKRTSKRVIAESIPLGHGQEKLARMKKDNLVKTLSGWFARPEEVSAADLGYEEEIPAEVTDTLATWLPAGMAFKSTEPETPASDEAIPEGDAAEESIAA